MNVAHASGISPGFDTTVVVSIDPSERDGPRYGPGVTTAGVVEPAADVPRETCGPELSMGQLPRIDVCLVPTVPL